MTDDGYITPGHTQVTALRTTVAPDDVGAPVQLLTVLQDVSKANAYHIAHTYNFVYIRAYEGCFCSILHRHCHRCHHLVMLEVTAVVPTEQVPHTSALLVHLRELLGTLAARWK